MKLKNRETVIHGAHFLRLCIDKAGHELKWKPLLDSSDAINLTLNWYKSWHKGDNDLQRLSLKQIHDYANRSREKLYNEIS